MDSQSIADGCLPARPAYGPGGVNIPKRDFSCFAKAAETTRMKKTLPCEPESAIVVFAGTHVVMRTSIPLTTEEESDLMKRANLALKRGHSFRPTHPVGPQGVQVALGSSKSRMPLPLWATLSAGPELNRFPTNTFSKRRKL